MAEPDKRPVTMEELLVSSLAQTDALAKLLIEKGLITREEFMQKISEERATYQKLFNPYKGHHIQSVPRHLLPDSERWTAQVLINWTDGSRKQFRQFDVKRGFATEEEAELEGLTFAKKWIDDGKPKLRERGTGGRS